MENTVAEKLLKNMEAELVRLDEKDLSPIERLRQVMPVIGHTIAEVKKLILDRSFNSREEEIYFFKNIKPRIYSHQIFEILLYNLRIQTPAGTSEMLKSYYEEELQQIFRFLRNEAFSYEYFKIRATELDHIYFVRDVSPVQTPVIDLIDPSPGFTTAWDYKFAKFTAYERLQELLIEQLTDAEPSVNKPAAGRGKTPVLKWTGDTINLVELAYGIWLTGQVNNGNAGIAEIMKFMESNFRVNIGRPFRRWQSISNRKRVSPVKFVDQIKDAILKRIDDENA